MFFAVVSTLLLLFVALVTAENVEVLSNGEVKASLLKSAVTTDLLQSFSDAWNAHDLDKVMTFMSEDSEFHAVAGPDLLGKSWVGKDQYYLQHSFHGHHLPTKNFLNKTGLVTKWQFYSIADCYDGDLGRGARCQRSEMKLEILVTGTAITTYVEIEDEITVFDGSSQKLNKEIANRTVRDTTNFVDNIQYRVTVNDQTWMTWIIAGDSLPPGTTPNDLTVIHTPLFKVVLEGGWSHRSKVHVHTRGDVDPALALLFAHLMTSEYAIPEIKSQIMFPIPSTCPDGSSLVNPVQSDLIITESEGFSMVE